MNPVATQVGYMVIVKVVDFAHLKNLIRFSPGIFADIRQQDKERV